MDGPCCRVPTIRARRALAAGCWLPAGCLLLGLGCIHQSAVTTTEGAGQPVPLEEAKDEPRHTPHASTCVAFGDLHSKVAADARKTPMQQDQIRQQACKDYQQALKIDADCAEAYLGLGRLYQQMSDYDRALATYQKGLKRLPKNAALWYELGLCQARHKDWELALANLKVATDLDPENVAYGKTRAFGLARVGRYDESFECFKQVTSQAQAHYNVARMLHYVQEDEACRRHLTAALAAQPDMEQAKHLLLELDKPAHDPGKSGVASVGFEQFDGDKEPFSGAPDNDPAEKIKPVKN
ncbi:MAG TPA: tetratricopeptide repeat protein [Gemmataceae bacterium]|nr:tetratricopeptide repeat protein [Gemmataceae bacterium]